MKIQNLSIIFLVIMIPILMILAYYLQLQEDTLEMQSDYNAKLSTSAKEAIRAYEINTVDWRNSQGETRRNVTASVNTFLTSLANNLGISGTAKEYMVNYVPAITMTMYDGYYMYTPTYVPDSIETDEGIQLYYNKELNEVTTNTSTNSILNDIIYKPKSDSSNKKENYTYKDKNGEDQTIPEFTTDATQAEKIYKHALSNKIAYSGNYTKGSNIEVTINYTLDNKIYVYGKINEIEVNEQGNLVYFDSTCNIPRITIKANAKYETDITVNKKIDSTIYNGSNINAEILTEQILYKTDEGKEVLETYKYVYDIQKNKLYYDDATEKFFTLDTNYKKVYLPDTEDILVSSEQCRFKSVSVLKNGNSEYKKLYQALNGRDKGKWYINLKDEDDAEALKLSEIGPGVEVVDTELDKTIFDYGFSAIYMDYSAISYYVEAYAFTNWIEENLGGTITQTKVELNETSNQYEAKEETISGVFNISEENDPESNLSLFSEHKREVMIDSINSNLNLAISQYSRNSENEYRLPVLSYSDWEQAFSNLSIIAFFQGVPIGLKEYNNYAIATSTLNRDYVDPNELYFSSSAQNYHRAYCTKIALGDIEDGTTGYRSVEYTLRTYEGDSNKIYYYQHDEQQTASSLNKNSELACYHCLINKANYTKTIDNDTKTAEEQEIVDIQSKSYKEALARERYYQNEDIVAKVGIMIRYHDNKESLAETSGGVNNMPDDQLVQPREYVKISSQTPNVASTNILIQWEFVGWSENSQSKTAEYMPGGSYTFETDTDLYAIWQPSLSRMPWNRDYKWTWNTEYWKTPAVEVNDGSISNIRITDQKDVITNTYIGSTVEMVGNGVYPGKGATWTTFSSTFLKISSFKFNYYINKGDSFNAAGFIFNVTDSNPLDEHQGTLQGYMLSINFTEAFKSKAENNNGAIFKFTYNKGKNNVNMESLELVEPLPFGAYSGNRNDYGNGTILIEVQENGYLVTGSELTKEYFIPVENMNSDTPKSFGFFSDHYSHGCPDIGYFKIDNLNITVTKK